MGAIRIVKVLKNGNKIAGYVCTDGASEVTVTKEQVVSAIREGKVANAAVQVYKGLDIVRIKDDNYLANKEAKKAGAPVVKTPKDVAKAQVNSVKGVSVRSSTAQKVRKMTHSQKLYLEAQNHDIINGKKALEVLKSLPMYTPVVVVRLADMVAHQMIYAGIDTTSSVLFYDESAGAGFYPTPEKSFLKYTNTGIVLDVLDPESAAIDSETLKARDAKHGVLFRHSVDIKGIQD